jgi:hypothetical protein
MSEEQANKKKIFKYNLSFYYQSTIIYFVVFLLYAIIRGEFVENSFTLITKDPIIYFFAIIVCVSLISLLYNLYLKRHLEIGENKISFVNRFSEKVLFIDHIEEIKISRFVSKKKNKAFRLIRLRFKNRKRRIIIRPYDYENVEELISQFIELKEKLESK